MTGRDSVTTVLVPAAGLGTRMMPATKVVPKELLPIVDRPIIQYGVDEAVAAGLRRVVLITNPGNSLTVSHFAADPELEAVLAARGKTGLVELIRALAAMAEVTSVPQPDPRGLGHAVLCGRDAVGGRPFAVLLPDDVIDATPPALGQMLDLFAEVDGPVLLVEEVPRAEVSQYGIVAVEPSGQGVLRVTDLVEKPTPEAAPSTLAIIGRYVLTPDLFDILASTGRGAGGEIQLTDGLRALLRQRPIYACRLKGTRHDAGNKLGYLKAILHFALKQPDLEPGLRAALAATLTP